MKSLLTLAAILLLSIASGAAGRVVCTDPEKSVEVTGSFSKSGKNPVLASLVLKSGGKTKPITTKDISRFVHNDLDFYILFKVESKTGPQELELNTRFVKNPRGNPGRASAGYLTNKSQGNERVPVTCRF